MLSTVFCLCAHMTHTTSDLQIVGRQSGAVVTKVSTVALDGRVVIWDLPTLGIEELTRALSL